MDSSMQKRIEEYENQVNDEINRLRRQESSYRVGDDVEFANHPKVKELAMRLAVARERSDRMAGARGSRVVRAAEPLEEAAPGQAEASPGLYAATRPDVLSSPYAGSEPRYARQYMNVPGGEIRPDPIERVKPDPNSELEGAVSPEEADYLPDGPQAVLSGVDGGSSKTPIGERRPEPARAASPPSRDAGKPDDKK